MKKVVAQVTLHVGTECAPTQKSRLEEVEAVVNKQLPTIRKALRDAGFNPEVSIVGD